MYTSCRWNKFEPQPCRMSFVVIGHEITSMAIQILSLPLIQVEQLPVTDKSI